jgi:phosphate transport system substrate-binding protein
MLNGSGSTFAAPMYSAWLGAYQKIHPDVQISYQAIGSGGGIRQVMENSVDFGASDDPMSEKQLRDYRDSHGCDMLHLPTLLGAAVPAYNVPGVGDLNFTGEILAGIYLGRIVKWDDPALREANPGVSLPSNTIMVVHRSEGSGTSYVWADYLSKVSDMWRTRVGKGTSLNWPIGLSARGNDGIADLLHKTPYSLGYVELGFALQKRLSYGRVRNAAGAFVKADLASVAAAATEATTNLPDDFRISITNAPGKIAYPISSFSWLLVPARITDPGKRRAIVDFLTWALTDGQNMGPEHAYARLPQSVVSKELTALSRIQ